MINAVLMMPFTGTDDYMAVRRVASDKRSMSTNYLILSIGLLLFGLESLAFGELSDRQQPDVIAAFKIRYNEEHVAPLIVALTIDGDDYNFELDTGSSNSIFDIRLRQLLKQCIGQSRSHGFGRSTVKRTYEAPACAIGSLPLPHLIGVRCEELPSRKTSNHPSIAGILGMDALRVCIVQFDFDRDEIYFLRSAPTDAGRGLSLISDKQPDGSRGNAVPVITGVIEGYATRPFLIDTGFNGEGLLAQSDFAALRGGVKLIAAGEFVGHSMSGTHRIQMAVLSSPLTIGDHRAGPLIFGELPRGDMPFNALGREYLSRYQVTLDFPNEQVYFKPGKAFAAIKPAADLFGVSLERARNRVVVRSIRDDSRAALHGRPGDILESIDRIPVASMSDVEVLRRLSDRRQESLLVFRRQRDDGSWWIRLPPLR